MSLGQCQMICLPHAGGGSALYQSAVQRGIPGLQIKPICLPGREARIREKPLTSMTSVLDWLDAQLEQTVHQPHILFGHSMGGIVGHALCLRRLERGLPLPQALIVSACLPPPVTRRKVLHKLDKASLLRALMSYDAANGALGKYPELWDLLEPPLRADFTVIETYHPTDLPRLPIPVIALSGRSDPMVAPEDMKNWAKRGSNFKHHVFDGGHFYLRDAVMDVMSTAAKSVVDLVDFTASA
ncbi:MAG: alpha/beta fold hydrolase [Sulfitobacter sp.]